MIEEYISTKKKIYNYSSKTGEFLLESKAPIDPIESKIKGVNIYARPAYSTFTEPPKTGENEIAVFENGEWTIQSDHRGKIIYSQNGEKSIISEIGIVFPSESIFTPPPEGFLKPKYIDGEWKEDAIIYKNIAVSEKKDVDLITSNLIKNLGEDKAKTEKLIAGNNPCESWDKFLVEREKLIQEGDDFIIKYNLK